MIQSAVVIGSGLLGTSAGMALARSGVTVYYSDSRERDADLAAALTGGRRWNGERSDVTLVAVPTPAIPEVVFSQIRSSLSRTIIDLGSVKTKPQVDVEALAAASGLSAHTYCPTHPMAGRERSGAESARGDLFEGRPWIITPAESTAPQAIADAEEVVRRCGALPIRMTADAHDQAVALLSHLPQVLASAMAATLVDTPSETVALAGTGLRDLIRIAGSDPELWTGILHGNAAHVSSAIDKVISQLVDIRAALADGDDKTVHSLIASGNAGRLKLPGKHGGASRRYVVIPVVIDDRPGQLAALFAAAGECQVNIEDLAMEHSPGQPLGLVELSVDPEASSRFIDYLRARAWRVHPPRSTVDTTTE